MNLPKNKNAIYAVSRMVQLLHACKSDDLGFFLTESIEKFIRTLYLQSRNPELLDILRRRVDPPRGFYRFIAYIAEKSPQQYPHVAKGELRRSTAVVHDVISLKQKNLAAAKEIYSILQKVKPTIEMIAMTDKLTYQAKEHILREFNHFCEAWEKAKALLKCAVKVYERESK